MCRPVFKMSQMVLYDAYQTHIAAHSAERDVGPGAEDSCGFDLDDVDAAFMRNASFVQLKFMQSRKLDGTNLTITPYAAGHTLGGSIWKVTQETDDLLYAPDFNHKKERHLNGTVLETWGPELRGGVVGEARQSGGHRAEILRTRS